MPARPRASASGALGDGAEEAQAPGDALREEEASAARVPPARPREPEVAQFNVGPVEEHILGLDVAVVQVPRVEVREPVRDAPHDARRGAPHVGAARRRPPAGCSPKSSMTKDRWPPPTRRRRGPRRGSGSPPPRARPEPPATFRSDSSDAMWYLLMRFTAQGAPFLVDGRVDRGERAGAEVVPQDGVLVEIKIYGAFLNRALPVLHVIGATPARRGGDVGSPPLGRVVAEKMVDRLGEAAAMWPFARSASAIGGPGMASSRPRARAPPPDHSSSRWCCRFSLSYHVRSSRNWRLALGVKRRPTSASRARSRAGSSGSPFVAAAIPVH